MNHTKQVAGPTLIQESCAARAQEAATNNQRSMVMSDSKETKHLKTLYCLLTDMEHETIRGTFVNTQHSKKRLDKIAALEWAIEQLEGVMK